MSEEARRDPPTCGRCGANRNLVVVDGTLLCRKCSTAADCRNSGPSAIDMAIIAGLAIGTAVVIGMLICSAGGLP